MTGGRFLNITNRKLYVDVTTVLDVVHYFKGLLHKHFYFFKHGG